MLRAVVLLAGLLQLENSNFEGVRRRKFNALSRDAYGFAPAEEFQFCAQEIWCSGVSIPLSPVSRQLNKQMEKKYIARVAEDAQTTSRVSGCLPQNFLCG